MESMNQSQHTKEENFIETIKIYLMDFVKYANHFGRKEN